MVIMLIKNPSWVRSYSSALKRTWGRSIQTHQRHQIPSHSSFHPIFNALVKDSPLTSPLTLSSPFYSRLLGLPPPFIRFFTPSPFTFLHLLSDWHFTDNKCSSVRREHIKYKILTVLRPQHRLKREKSLISTGTSALYSLSVAVQVHHCQNDGWAAFNVVYCKCLYCHLNAKNSQKKTK